MQKLFLLIFLISPLMHSQNPHLIWSEEFDAKKLDKKVWNFKKGFGHNYEEQYYTSRNKNIKIEDGLLIIEARKEDYKNSNYTSARINTSGKQYFKYGRIEIRAKLPQGNGVWPAIWMLGENRKRDGYPACGEIDIMEFVGNDPTHVHGAVHFPEMDNKKIISVAEKISLSNTEDDFHTYAIEWSEKSITYFVDGASFHCFNIEDAEREGLENIFKKPFYLIINLALGGNWAGEIDNSIFPARFYIDYIRYYKI